MLASLLYTVYKQQTVGSDEIILSAYTADVCVQ